MTFALLVSADTLYSLFATSPISGPVIVIPRHSTACHSTALTNETPEQKMKRRAAAWRYRLLRT